MEARTFSQINDKIDLGILIYHAHFIITFYPNKETTLRNH